MERNLWVERLAQDISSIFCSELVAEVLQRGATVKALEPCGASHDRRGTIHVFSFGQSISSGP